MLTLLQKYTEYAKTEAFKIQSREYIYHVTRYNDGWALLIEVYKSKADFPTAAPVFPAEFPEALQLEIKTVQSNHTKQVGQRAAPLTVTLNGCSRAFTRH
jgi:hypothetical protein